MLKVLIITTKNNIESLNVGFINSQKIFLNINEKYIFLKTAMINKKNQNLNCDDN